ncbi:MAG: DNA gyrase inhibitor YacG [Maritimibacter sp.]|nr:DNA gyrase inhibitor YacG [Maritimibacter sp.]
MSCPICGKDTADRFRPFCSKRCADIDLGRWLNGAYFVAAEDPEELEEAAEELARTPSGPH